MHALDLWQTNIQNKYKSKTTFNQRLKLNKPLRGLIQTIFNKYDNRTILKAASNYVQDIPSNDSSTLKAMLSIWRCQWRRKEPKQDSTIDTLPH